MPKSTTCPDAVRMASAAPTMASTYVASCAVSVLELSPSPSGRKVSDDVRVTW